MSHNYLLPEVISVTAGMVLGCKRGWLPFRNSCYRIVKQSVSRTAAQTTCGRMASKLASIADRNENNFIAGNLPKGTLVLSQNQHYFNTHIS
jgi:hypothetical protein